MSYRFSENSMKHLKTIHPNLQMVLYDALEIMDFAVICGVRNKEAQEEAQAVGLSNVDWPDSAHNVEIPETFSRAADLWPAPYQWEDKAPFYELAGVVKACAHARGVKIKWGGDFKSFFDGPHFELVDS